MVQPWVGLVEPYTDSKNSPLEAQKVENDPKNKSKSKVIIKGKIENKIYLTWTPKLVHVGPKKPKPAPEVGQR